jgi:hypothetical protein
MLTRLALLTLHSLLSISFVVAIILLMRRRTALAKMSQISCIHKVLFHMLGIILRHDIGIGQNVSQRFDLVSGQFRGKLDMKGNVQIALDKRIPATWHAFVLDSSYIGQSATRLGIRRLALNNLAGSGLDANFATVQVSKLPLYTRKTGM